MNHRNLRTAMRVGMLPAGIAIALAPAFAVAQEGGEQQATTLDRIEVTGSRIKRADVETSQPIFTLSRAEIQKQGVTSVADVLQRISSNGAALNSTFNNGGDGSAGISLRNLGEGRTLVLVNGRRWTQGLGGSVDLNTIPTAMIERVEVLKDGASTIYGSDAIAGVVNIITRQNFEGAEAGAYVGQYSQGDGNREAYDFTIGTGNDRGNVMIGASYVKEEAVMAGDRQISAGGPPFFGGQSTTGIPGSFVDTDNVRYIIDPVTGAKTRFNSDIHGYNSAPDNYLLTPQERTSLFAQANYDITDNVRFKTEMLYNERISEQLLAAMPVTGMRLSANSYYNPTNPTGFYAGTPAFQTGGARDLIGVARRFQESGGRSFNQNVKNWHFYGGLEGFFEIGERTFDWDTGYRYDRSDENDLTYGLFNRANLALAYGPSFRDTDGTIRCGTAASPLADCVPVNPIGSTGSISQEAIDYTAFTAHDSSRVTSKSYYANVSGDIVDLPAGPLAFAAGYEHRTEDGQFDPDAFIAAGLSTGNGSKPTAGGYKLDEYYLELAVPVLADLPGAKLLDFSLATRYSDFSNFGNTLNSKFGFRWKPIDDLMVRGNWSEGFRAPTINNLYAGNTDSFESYDDPCDARTGQLGNAQVAARCAAEGVSSTFTRSQRQTAEPFTWSSNEELQPETSTTKTLGFVYNPSFLEGFDISLDWYEIKIENAISRPEAQFILDKCYAGTASEQAVYCGLYSRDPAYPGAPNTITNLEMPLLNLAEYTVEGWDMTVNYRFPETTFGKFSVTWDTAYTSNWSTKATVDSPEEQRQGLYLPQDPYWRIKSNLYLDWTYGDFGATWGMRYKSGLDETCVLDNDDGLADAYCSDPDRVTADGPAPRNYLGAVTYHDIQVRYNTPWNATVSVGANNVFDKEPPTSYSSPYNNFDPQYDLPGAFYYVQYRQRF
ncbi:iron complex outermembrane receptor protein [Lysobacter sp. OAE881]|uniref:TonB-dependent receptor n=1 Tax=Lysobacter sp. OAE881 TaxID=2663813 RepID=UPI0017899D17